MSEIVCDEGDEGWKPVRDGDRYCSPKCGFGCKWEDYLRACEAARALCEIMGDGWTPTVCENSMRWHYSVGKGRATIYAHPDWTGNRGGRTEYACFFNTDVKQFTHNAADPAEALAASLADARAAVLALNRNIAAVECEDLEPVRQLVGPETI